MLQEPKWLASGGQHGWMGNQDCSAMRFDKDILVETVIVEKDMAALVVILECLKKGSSWRWTGVGQTGRCKR
jgi:hypothetical protein